MKQETIFFRLEILSPLHLGCDEDYEPTNFVVDKQAGELINFDPLDFIGNLDGEDKAEFSRICEQGTVASLLDIFKFMQRHAVKANGRRVKVGSGFLEHYAKTLEISERDQRRIRKELNQFRIERTAFQPLTGISYIPGSAIKGALRTAVLNLRKPEYPSAVNQRDRRAGQNLEKTIFDGGSFATDPMRLVKVSDFVAETEPENRIVYAVNKKKKSSKYDFSAPYQILEIIEPGAVFVGSISIILPEGERGDLPRKPVTFPELKRALNSFFVNEKKREDRQLQTVGIEAGKNPDETEKLLLRIGRHSGAESLTIDGYRHIKIMQGHGNSPKHLDHATTFWLAADFKKPPQSASLRPFGWLSATPLSAAELLEIREIAEKQRQAENKHLEHLSRQRRAEEEERLVKKREAEAVAARVAAEEQALKAELDKKAADWNNLSEEVKEQMIVRGDDWAREFVPVEVDAVYANIWPQLDSFAPERQQKLALAFKERWQRENKWSVGKKKKKQFEKVQKVKSILGES